ncbi:batten's disease protein Cln3, partial [Fistulina hepatica ATCC 64428]
RLLRHLGWSFFIFGLFNNVLYVIILSAALDLVPPSTPKGIIAFVNIAPALVAKLGWPYVLKGRIRYARRLLGCYALSTLGMIVVALFESLSMKLLGIAFASFSSGLGELTFLQLSTTYGSCAAEHGIGYFASGTGAAGIVGALVWWEVRSIGVRFGVGLSSIFPAVIPLTYYFLLPRQIDFVVVSNLSDSQRAPLLVNEASRDEASLSGTGSLAGGIVRTDVGNSKLSSILSANDKYRLVKPMLLTYMLPLFSVYLFEYTINQGVSPTLVYPVPAEDHWLLSSVIHTIRDYYPLWQLTYQTTVFISRSSISFGIPPIPKRWLAAPAVLQGLILLVLSYESSFGFFRSLAEVNSVTAQDRLTLHKTHHDATADIIFVFLLVSLEGLCGGSAYVNVFYHINRDTSDDEGGFTTEEREFRIGCVGFADSTGILLASLLAMPTEVGLCRAQVQRGKTLCLQV